MTRELLAIADELRAVATTGLHFGESEYDRERYERVLGLVAVRGWIPNLTRAALVLSLAPSAVELFVLLPESGRGMLGTAYGALTPVVILAANAFWGWLLVLGVRRVEGAG